MSLFFNLKKKAINDSNLKCLIRIFASETKSDLEISTTTSTITTNATKSTNNSNKKSIDALIKSTGSAILTNSTKSFTNTKMIWTKMCRLAANLFIDKSSVQVKSLFNNGKYKLVLDLLNCIYKRVLRVFNQVFD